MFWDVIQIELMSLWDTDERDLVSPFLSSRA